MIEMRREEEEWSRSESLRCRHKYEYEAMQCNQSQSTSRSDCSAQYHHYLPVVIVSSLPRFVYEIKKGNNSELETLFTKYNGE